MVCLKWIFYWSFCHNQVLSRCHITYSNLFCFEFRKGKELAISRTSTPTFYLCRGFYRPAVFVSRSKRPKSFICRLRKIRPSLVFDEHFKLCICYFFICSSERCLLPASSFEPASNFFPSLPCLLCFL